MPPLSPAQHHTRRAVPAAVVAVVAALVAGFLVVGAPAAAAETAVSRWGGIDVWINNAMATIFAPVEAVTPEEFRRVTEVTYLGQVHGTLAALRYMRRRGTGTIVQIAYIAWSLWLVSLGVFLLL